MKFNSILVSKNAPVSQIAHKAIQTRGSTAKQATHRYERRKVREFLRHGLDGEEDLLRLERFG